MLVLEIIRKSAVGTRTVGAYAHDGLQPPKSRFVIFYFSETTGARVVKLVTLNEVY